jgi:hypothetical protein
LLSFFQPTVCNRDGLDSKGDSSLKSPHLLDAATVQRVFHKVKETCYNS